MGIGIASQDAFAAGVFPDPDTQQDEPQRGWIWRDDYLVQDSTNTLPPILRVSFDLHSQRKIDRGELYYVVDNNLVVGTAFNIRVKGLIRQLFLT